MPRPNASQGRLHHRYACKRSGDVIHPQLRCIGSGHETTAVVGPARLVKEEDSSGIIHTIITDLVYEKQNVETPLEVFCLSYKYLAEIIKLSCYWYFHQIMQLTLLWCLLIILNGARGRAKGVARVMPYMALAAIFNSQIMGTNDH